MGNMNIYFCGIGGAALSALALLAHDCGLNVAGSDNQPSRNTDLLKKQGVTVFTSQTGTEIASIHVIQPIDWMIVSSAILDTNPEVQFAKKNGIKISKRHELLNEIIQQKNLKLIAVSGTHGKTTATAMLVWLFKRFKQPVSYSIGTNISFGPSAAYVQGSEYFVYEADEYDRNFLNFRPYISLIPSLDYDHPDTFADIADYKSAFKTFITQSHCTYTWSNVADYLNIENKSCLHVLDQADLKIKDFRLTGAHNRHHAFLTTKVIQDIFPHCSRPSLLNAINAFPGTERRFEKLADNLYTDYAHHPDEIAATLQLASELSDSIVVVYQPHQNRRQHVVQDLYKDCFGHAKKVYWLPTYLSREDPKQLVLNPTDLINKLTNPTIAQAAEMNEELVQAVNNHRQSGDSVIVMGAGSVDAWTRQNLA
jgi:UDP-N-acetylmuramate--alanine ligase